MAQDEAKERELRRRADELYWNSDRSVNQIAEDLGLSKSALYGYVRPLPADQSCPDCGGGLVYANRTAQDRGMLQCPTCSWEGSLEEAVRAETPGVTGRRGTTPSGGSDAGTGKKKPRAAGGSSSSSRRSAGDGPKVKSDQASEASDESGGLRFPELEGPDRWLAAGAVLGIAAGILWIAWRRRS